MNKKAKQKNIENSEAVLLKSCLKGNESAYKTLYDKYVKSMYNSALRILNDSDSAKDITQEAFIKAFENLTNYKAESSFGYWLKRIVINLSLNQLKKNQRFIIWENIDEVEIKEEYKNELKYSVNQIKEAILKMPRGYQLVFNLKIFEGLEHKEIADLLNISENTSKSQFRKAKLKLRILLENGGKNG